MAGISQAGHTTTWYTPDGDGWPTLEEAVEHFVANHNGEKPTWVQRIDETAYEPEHPGRD